MLLIKLYINGRKFMSVPYAAKVKKMVKFYVPTWALFAGPVTNVMFVHWIGRIQFR